MTLRDKRTLVTGAGRGIGRAIALAYAAEGARVAVADVDDAAGEETVALIGGLGGEAFFAHTDVTSEADQKALVDAVVVAWGGLDVACNNAGVAPPMTPLAEITPELWHRVIDVDLTGVFLGVLHQLPAMLAAGGGTILNMGSILSRVAFPGLTPYTAAKHGVDGITRQIALEYAARGIRAVTIGPAFIRTGLEAALEPAVRADLDAQHPAGRMGDPEEVARAAVFLAGDGASFINGAYIPVDGGFLTR
ncbi:SDR family NAD(P)-dependent oxidoreductase [Streptomyces sp. SID8352]|uniref:SDR family NAD(P)-dependent oxidoreductase n=1 Tax=Streptomyces sp. SID8352 TaxID=2690338 RepID=UPI00136C6B6A|nr:SDR family NAD(P)-dependent oxidoreductase [Streptomyces sp. SID8352]MYU22560.1 SDR family oxidoreductase [Streptomyces sp. SID8352]